jgi:sugar phosphate isomerase/epimerase
MKIAVSNIAWEHKYLSEYLKLLKQLGCSGVEIAPSIIWAEPANSSMGDRKICKDHIHKEGWEMMGFQA